MSGTDLNEAFLFTQVVAEGSFRGAARKLGVPKSTVSRKVADLEERLGARLLQRTTRKVGLTDAGERYFQRARAAIEELQAAETMVHDLEAEPSGRLRISAATTFAVVFLSDVVTAFAERWPKIEIEVDAQDRRVDLVAEGYDLAIRIGELNDSSLMSRVIGRGDGGYVASPGYLKAHGTPASPDALEDHRFIIHTARPRPDAMPFTLDGRTQLVSVRSRLRFNHLIMVRSAALRGHGIAMLPRFLATDALRRGELEVVLEEFAPAQIKLHAVYPSSRQLSTKVRAFVDFLVERTELTPWTEEGGR